MHYVNLDFVFFPFLESLKSYKLNIRMVPLVDFDMQMASCLYASDVLVMPL